MKIAWIGTVLVGCGSPAFIGSGFDGEEDGGVDASVQHDVVKGDAAPPDVVQEADAPPDILVPEPPCCVDADCPESIPFCSPWGTCYQGGDPYNCDYDSFCESFCVHCSGSAAGACDEKRCVCS